LIADSRDASYINLSGRSRPDNRRNAQNIRLKEARGWSASHSTEFPLWVESGHLNLSVEQTESAGSNVENTRQTAPTFPQHALSQFEYCFPIAFQWSDLCNL